MYHLDDLLRPVFKTRGTKMKARYYDVGVLGEFKDYSVTPKQIVKRLPKPVPVYICECGCGSESVGRKWIPSHLKRFTNKQWKLRNPDKVKSQKARARQRRPSYRGPDNSDIKRLLAQYLHKWSPVTRLRVLQKAWTNITSWVVLIPKFAHNHKALAFRSFWHVLRKSWSNITSWAKCLGWSVIYSPDPETEFRYLVYGLIDPRTLEVRYVGKSTSGLHRPKQHRNKRGGDNGYKLNWLKNLQKCGLTYSIAILEVCSLDSLSEQEAWWISYARMCGWRLTNLTDGGDGCTGRVLSAATKAKISLARKIGGPVNPRPKNKRAERTHCINGHEYTSDNISKGKSSRGRRCLMCCRLNNIRRRNKFKNSTYL
jgi:hypothetical protein